MKKRSYIFLFIALGAYYSIYTASFLLHWNMLNDILSPAGLLLAFSLALYLAVKRKDLRPPVSLISMAYLTWGVINAFWGLSKYGLRINPEGSPVFAPLYLIPSIFFTLSLVFFIVRQRNPDTLQVVLDIFAMALTGLAVIWILFFHNEFQNLLKLNVETISIFLYILFDIFIISCAIIWYIAKPMQKRTFSTHMFFLGILLQAVTDIVYTYLYLNNLYAQNSFIDQLYTTAIVLIACVCLREAYRPGVVVANMLADVDGKKTGRYFKRSYLLLSPILVIALKKNVDALEILFVLSIALIHLAVTNFIQNNIHNKKMLEQQMAMNALLEDCVTERTAQLLQINEELEVLSKQDSITNLYNRRYFLTALEEMISDVSGSQSVVLFYMDLDRFKSINDAYGHDIGDKILIETAARMHSCVRKESILARLGGDEFVFAFRGRYDMEKAAKIAEDIIGRFSEPILVEPYAFHVTLCIGITFYPSDAADGNTLMKNADIAMYHAKGLGFNQYAFFGTLRNKNILRRYDIEMMLKNANYDEEFETYYQPVFKLPEGTLLGAEALLRWNSPKKGRVMPAEFIPVAEETGIIIPLGEWVLEKTFAQIAEWNTRFNRDLQLTINLSPKQLDSLGLTDKLFSLIKQYKIRPGWVDIEITKSASMREKSKITVFFKKIAKAGITISIDDFGMGHFPLVSLKQMPVDRIKIPKALIDSITTDERDAAIVKAIVLVAKTLNIHVIAEGVENSSQYDILNAFGCDEIQGYLSGRPMPAAAFENTYLLEKPAENGNVAIKASNP